MENITKEQYIEYRNKNQIPVSLAWEYYCLKTEEKNRVPFNHFGDLFQHFFGINCFNFIELYQYYDSKFELTFIIDKEGNLIRCYG